MHVAALACVGNFHRMMNLRLRKRGRFSFARKKKVFTNQFITPPAWMLRKQSGFSFLPSFAARLCTPWPLFFFDATRKCAPAFLCLCALAELPTKEQRSTPAG